MIGSRAPRIVVFNKVDRIDDPGKRARLEALYPEAAYISATTGQGLDALQARLADFFDRALRPVRLLFPYSDGAAMSRLRGVASDLREEHTPHGVIVEARLPVAEAARYARYDAAAAAGAPEGRDEPGEAAESPSAAAERERADSVDETDPAEAATQAEPSTREAGDT